MKTTVKLLTVGQIRNFAMDKNYIALSNHNGILFGVNAKSIFVGKNRQKTDSQKTEYIGLKDISFMEYISTKTKML